MQRKARTVKEEKLKQVLNSVKALTATCGMRFIPVDTTVTGNFSSIQNIGTLPVTIDVSECAVTGIDDWPEADFTLAGGVTMYGDFTSISIDNPFGISMLDPFFNLIAVEKC